MSTITIAPRQVAIETKDGLVTRTLTSGKHRRIRGATYTIVDLREQLLTVAPQEVLTADGAQVRVSAAVWWAVGDPIAFHEKAVEPLSSVYLATQVALRDALGAVGMDALAQRGARLPVAEITAAVAAVGLEVGIRVVEVIVKDVILPAELRAAATAVLAAKQRGLAQLEAARAETAALRSLANGAQLLDRHPALATLRAIQSAPPGTQLVLRLGGGEERAPGQ
ncbi:MAG: slipin family protein [Tetrasphaera sp.]|nr:slipin family protein [Tetrasphaera sp.]